MVAMSAYIDVEGIFDNTGFESRKVAAKSAFRLLDSYKPNTEDLEGHLKIYKDF
jgi:hypothetical protein